MGINLIDLPALDPVTVYLKAVDLPAMDFAEQSALNPHIVSRHDLDIVNMVVVDLVDLVAAGRMDLPAVNLTGLSNCGSAHCRSRGSGRRGSRRHESAHRKLDCCRLGRHELDDRGFR